MINIDKTSVDPMVEDYEPNPVTFPPMTWAQALDWLLGNGYTTIVFPTKMIGGCVSVESARSTSTLLDHHANKEPERTRYVIETGVNAHDREVAWVYEEGIPMEEWHVYQSGCAYHLERGAEEPDEYPWSHWPHCALGVRHRSEKGIR